jgi:hypothetical protein
MDVLSDTTSFQKSKLSINSPPFDKKDQENLNNQYVMGYFNWYWKKYGMLKAFFNFFAKKMANDIVYSVFYYSGMAIGTFMMTKHWLPRLTNWLKFPELLDSQF